ncbi:Flp pilus assembly protein CpaB [Corticibacter populi]|uniref:Flp pilus assembly protein CpaB n=1 Tax=Corticibacter populi TaxID=1550736 RepID=UPI0010EC2AD5|nr:Flp pilus assembly protein CpaB [Corticibacter populi]RZS33702.1 Flp pilus assembly protein CpaB [Corticibacter populi]
MAVSFNKNWLILVGALALGAAAFYLSNKTISNRIAQIEEEAARGRIMVPVVVAAIDLGAGDVIDSSVVAVREIPQDYVNANAVVPDSYDGVDGAVLDVNVQRGEPILSTYVANRGSNVLALAVKDGRRALTIDVDDLNSLSRMLRPGDIIDLMLTVEQEVSGGQLHQTEKQKVTLPLLSNVEVLATGQSVKNAMPSGDGSSQYSTVTLNVTPEEATQILVAKEGGTLRAVLRGVSDTVVPNPSRPQTLDDVLAGLDMPVHGRRGGPEVEFIIGGSSQTVSGYYPGKATEAAAQELVQGLATALGAGSAAPNPRSTGSGAQRNGMTATGARPNTGSASAVPDAVGSLATSATGGLAPAAGSTPAFAPSN